jgi:hypothetical protein
MSTQYGIRHSDGSITRADSKESALTGLQPEDRLVFRTSGEDGYFAQPWEDATTEQAAAQVKPGFRFRHLRQITKSCSVENPVYEPCRVTRTNSYAVWYQNSTGFKSVVDRDKFPHLVREILPPERSAP